MGGRFTGCRIDALGQPGGITEVGRCSRWRIQLRTSPTALGGMSTSNSRFSCAPNA